ncbi:MAG TPA: presenilin family intramembrane aspartyl protease PSH [Natrialbaceae archaeon]|nr:presenilin family intramembrane aspartyl protease PSH [Natrialbaceae archaeon]
MKDSYRVGGAVSLVVLIFLLVQLGALALVRPFAEAGFQQTQNPQDPTNSLLYLVLILIMTGVMLAAFKYGLHRFIRALLVFVSGLIALYVFSVFAPPAVAIGLAAVLGLALLVYPEWYVIDGAGVIMGAGAAGLFGISFGILPAILLLSVLAVYDAISVYGTEHMLDLAEGVMDLKVPVVLVVPISLSYSFLEEGSTPDEVTNEAGEPADPEESAQDDETAEASEIAEADENGQPAAADGDESEIAEGAIERGALFIGLGDAVMPAIVVASAAFFLSANGGSVATFDVPWVFINLPALTAMIGTLSGLLVLMYMVLKGRPHAGLPLLNGGAILGYLVGALASGLSLAAAIGL